MDSVVDHLPVRRLCCLIPLTLPTPIIRARRSAVGAVVRLAQPLAKTSNLRGFASCPLRSGGGASTPAQLLLPRASCRHATSAGQQGQISGVESSKISDDRSTKDGERLISMYGAKRKNSVSLIDSDRAGTTFMRQIRSRCAGEERQLHPAPT